jgi:exodeoxyribonuclease VII large subunit
VSADLFGSAEPAREEPRVLTVSELTRTVRSTLEDRIGVVWVEGEISNYRKQPSGHQYFTLKDAQSQVACVWFARPGLRLRQVALADGMQVQVRGVLTVYEARGQYQLNVQLVQAGGAGLLQAKFEALKRKLEAEGLFDPARKRALPRFPTAIGLVTSASGAALRDILNILARRAPWVRIVINPVRVQGEGAAEEIAAAITELNQLAESGLSLVDIILVTRGGGSVEDLWEFNEEVIARAIVASTIPVASAVGHEIDFTIADFAADLRAPTPSAAAELLVPDGAELRQQLVRLRTQLQREVAGPLLRARNELANLARSAAFRSPVRRLREAAQRIDTAADKLQRNIAAALENDARRAAELAARVQQQRPHYLLSRIQQEVAALNIRVQRCARQCWQRQKERASRLETLLHAVSPQATMARGYSITTNLEGAIVRSVKEVKTGAKIITHLRDGSVSSTVN